MTYLCAFFSFLIKIDFTKKMLDAYMDNMKQEYVDKETNTECAFPPEKSRSQQGQQSADDRPVKRSQTFTPSAAVGKSRYICRLNRSDSDSAMHFGVTPHPFHRGAIERRSLRFHTKAPKTATSRFLFLCIYEYGFLLILVYYLQN